VSWLLPGLAHDGSELSTSVLLGGITISGTPLKARPAPVKVRTVAATMESWSQMSPWVLQAMACRRA
jgi:hypothetical protein